MHGKPLPPSAPLPSAGDDSLFIPGACVFRNPGMARSTIRRLHLASPPVVVEIHAVTGDAALITRVCSSSRSGVIIRYSSPAPWGLRFVFAFLGGRGGGPHRVWDPACPGSDRGVSGWDVCSAPAYSPTLLFAANESCRNSEENP